MVSRKKKRSLSKKTKKRQSQQVLRKKKRSLGKKTKKPANLGPEYMELFEIMRKNYELWHQLSNEAWKKYSETWQKAVE